jgi:hypothetical protein
MKRRHSESGTSVRQGGYHKDNNPSYDNHPRFETFIIVSALTLPVLKIYQTEGITKNLSRMSFNFRPEMVYHDYQSHFRIHARFSRRSEDIDHICDEFDRIYLNLPHQAFMDF